MNRHRLSQTVVSVVLLYVFALVPPAWSGDMFGPPNPAELKMTSEPLAPGAPAIILYRQVDRDDSGLQDNERDYVRIKVLTEEGRKYADVELPYLKGSGSDISSIRARTIRPDGTVVPFDGKIFDKSIVKGRGIRYMAKTFTLPDVQVGSIIEYAYVVNFPEYLVFDSRWIISDELFTKEASFSLKPYARMGCRWMSHVPPGAEFPKVGPDHVVRLDVKNIPAFQSEDFMPPENQLKFRVDFAYSEDNVDVHHPETYWKSVDKKWDSTLEHFVSKHKAMEEAVAQIVSPNDTPEVKLAKIYARVQQLRNTSYEVQKTAQERKRDNEKAAENVEQVWKRGMGDGGQLTWLFLGLARAAGLEAHGVWVADRSNYFFTPNSMDEHKLNSNVVVVKVNGKDLYFDPGSAFTPFGMLPWGETDAVGLELDKDKGEWITTPVPNAGESRITRQADLRLTDTGSLEGMVTETFTGLEALRLRVGERNEDEAARKKYLENLFADDIPTGATIELANKPDWNSSSDSFTAQFKIKIPGWITGAGRRAFFPVGIFAAAEKHVFDHAQRVYPIYFDFPFSRHDDITITLPLGMQVASLPKAIDDKGGTVVEYQMQAKSTAASMHLVRDLRVDALLLDTKYYAALRDFFQAVRSGDEQQAVLQPMGANGGN